MLEVRRVADIVAIKQDAIAETLTTEQLVSSYNGIFDYLGHVETYDDRATAFETLSVILLKLTKLLKKNGDAGIQFHNDTIQAVSSSLDHSNKSVVNISITNFLNKAIGYLKAQKSVVLILEWTEFLIKVYVNSKVYINVLELLLKNVSGSIKSVCDQNPSFIQILVKNFGSDSLANASGKLLVAVFQNIHKYECVPWLEVWDPVIYEYLQMPQYSKNIQTYFLPLAFKVDNLSFQQFVYKHFKSSNADTKLMIKICRIGVNLGKDLPQVFAAAKIDFGLDDLLSNADISIRLDAMNLLCYSPKSTVPFKSYGILQENLQHIIMDLNTVESRSSFINTMYGLFVRIRDSTHHVMKTAKTKDPRMFDEYKLFFEWLVGFICMNTSPDSTYHQTFVALQLLSRLVDLNLDGSHHVLDNEKRSAFPFKVELFTSSITASLLNNVNHNFEDIRLLSAEISTRHPGDCKEFLTDAYSVESMLPLCFSLKSRVSEGAAKYFEVVARLYQKKNYDYGHVWNEFHKILSEVDITQPRSTIKPNMRVHGVLEALKLSLQAFPVSFFQQNQSYWSSYFNHFFEIDATIWNSILHFLTDASGTVDPDKKQITTNFCWRYIKESTELASVIFKLMETFDTDIRCRVTVKQYIELLTTRIPDINHRGAVSSVYPSLITLISFCYDIPIFQSFPKNLLDECLSVVENKTQLITRRSGGLPVLITAVLTGEKAARGSCAELMSLTFNRLLSLTEVEVSSHEEHVFDLPQVNAMNCMRNIINDSILASDCKHHLGDVLRLCLKNFSSPIWSIRNCALMLFTSLKNKLFPHTKQSSTYFFSTYHLKEVLVGYLESGDLEIAFPVLTIISNFDFTGDDENLSLFERSLMKLLAGTHWKIREMAARTFAEILPSAKYAEKVKMLVDTLQKGGGDRNAAHGCFLTVLEIVKIMHHKRSEDITEVVELTVPLIETLQWSTLKVYVELMSFLDTVPEFVTLRLNAIFMQNVTVGLDGLKKLALNEVLKFLLHKGDTKVIVDAAIGKNFDFTVIVLDYIIQKTPKIDLEVIWTLLRNDNLDDYIIVRALDCLLQYSSAFDEACVLPLVQKRNPEVKYKALQVLVHFEPSLAIEFKDLVLGQYASESEMVRSSCIQMVARYLLDVKKGDKMYTAFLVELFLYITDDDDTIRDKAVSVLSTVMNLPYTVPAYSLIYKFEQFFHKAHVEHGLPYPSTDTILSYCPSIESKIAAYRDDVDNGDEMFLNEIPNPYRKDSLVQGKLVSLISNNTTIGKKETSRLQEYLQTVSTLVHDTLASSRTVPGYTWNQNLISAVSQFAALETLLNGTSDINLQQWGFQIDDIAAK